MTLCAVSRHDGVLVIVVIMAAPPVGGGVPITVQVQHSRIRGAEAVEAEVDEAETEAVVRA